MAKLDELTAPSVRLGTTVDEGPRYGRWDRSPESKKLAGGIVAFIYTTIFVAVLAVAASHPNVVATTGISSQASAAGVGLLAVLTGAATSFWGFLFPLRRGAHSAAALLQCSGAFIAVVGWLVKETF